MNKQYLRLPIDELIPYENNPRINDEAAESVAKSIEQCGYIAPIITDEDMVILGGHTRVKAMKQLGIKECDVLVVSGLTDEQKRKYRLLDNKTAELADWDFEKLEQELDGLDLDDFDFGIVDIDYINELMESGMRKAEEVENNHFAVTFTFNRDFKDSYDNFVDLYGKEAVMEMIIKGVKKGVM